MPRLIDADALQEVKCLICANINTPTYGYQVGWNDAINSIIENAPTIPAIILPCNVGDTVYRTDGYDIFEEKINKIVFLTKSGGFDEYAIGTSIFITREDAERYNNPEEKKS